MQAFDLKIMGYSQFSLICLRCFISFQSQQLSNNYNLLDTHQVIQIYTFLFINGFNLEKEAKYIGSEYPIFSDAGIFYFSRSSVSLVSLPLGNIYTTSLFS